MLRTLATAVALLLGLFAASVVFAGASSAATGRHVVIDKVANGNVGPSAVFTCSSFFPSPTEFDYFCTVTSGQIELVVLCAGQPAIMIPIAPPGGSGVVRCPGGIVAVQVFTVG